MATTEVLGEAEPEAARAMEEAAEPKGGNVGNERGGMEDEYLSGLESPNRVDAASKSSDDYFTAKEAAPSETPAARRRRSPS
jgi:hypothetical protein